MLNNITMGQYYPVDSKVHRLDPRVKLILTIVFIVTVFMARTFLGYAVILGFVWLTSRLANVPFRMLLRGLKPLRLIIILTFLLNLFFTTGETVWVEFWGIRITQEGFMHFPAHELAMMMTIALRFIPTLLEETDKIMKAQMARGADFESGNLLSRAKAMVPLLVPLFVSAFRRAGDLAMAMESRCYHGGEGRTRLRVLKITRNDWIACGAVAALLALIILEGIIF